MADIIFRYPEMNNTAKQIRGFAEEYRQAATTFVQQIQGAIDPWEGASKEKFLQFITGPVQKYIGETVPQVVEGLAQMLEANARQMQEADEEIAKSLPSDL